MAAGSIVVDLLMRTGSFETDTDRAAKSLAKFKKEAAQTAKEVGAVLGVAAAAAGTALVAITKQAIDAADQLTDLSERTGVAVEKLSALQYAADMSGVSADELTGGLDKLNKALADAAGGAAGPAAAFDVLGVAVKAADGSLRSADAVLVDLADAFAGAADGPQKTAAAIRIFGEAGARLVPLLNQGAAGIDRLMAEAKALGIVVGGETAKAAADFNDQLAQLRKQTDALGLAIASATLPGLKAITSELVGGSARARDMRDAVAELASDGVVGVVRLAESLVGVTRAAYAVGGSFQSVAADLRLLGTVAERTTFSVGGLFSADNRAAIKAAFDERQRMAAEANQRYIDLWNYDGTRISRAVEAAFGTLPQASYSNEGRTYARPVAPKGRLPQPPSAGRGQDIVARFDALTPEQEIAQSIGRLIEESDIIKAERLALQIEYLDKLFFEAGLDARVYESAMRKLTGQTDGATDATSDFLAEQQRLANLLGNTASAQLEEQRADMLLLAKAFEDGRIGVNQYYEAVAARLGTAQIEAERTKSLADELGMTFSSAFEDAIVSGGKLSDVLQGLSDDIMRLVTRELVTKPLADSITGFVKGAMGSGGGGIGDFISSAFSSIFGGGRAIGGPVSAGGLYQVNERGSPEMLQMDGREFLLMGNRRGWVDPALAAAAGGGSRSVVNHVTVNVPEGTGRATASQIGAEIARRIRVAELRNG